MPVHRKRIHWALDLLLAAVCLWPLTGVADASLALASLQTQFESVADEILALDHPSGAGTLPGQIARLRRILASEPSDESRTLALAAAELEFGMQRAATRRLDVLLTRSPPGIHDDALCIKARWLHGLGRFEASLALLQEARVDGLGAHRDACRLFKGIVQQETGHYRESLTVLGAIPATAPEYPAAQFNIAVAEIRNGWWSDGEGRIARLATALPETDKVGRSLVDRFHTTIGYARLERGYYRQARQAFRQVRRDGPYTDRALLGLALAAMQQERFGQALTLAEHLAASGRQSLPAEEARLVTPYLYDRMHRDGDAREAYEKAVAYFEYRLASLSAPDLHPRDRVHHELSPQGHRALQQWIRRIDALEQYAPGASTEARIAALRQSAAQARRALVQEAIDTRREQLQSYLSQARYGLAHVLDRANSRQTDR